MGVEPIAQSPLMKRVMKLAELYAPSDCPVLLTGDTGTGKTLLARWIHSHSPRADKPYEARNCAAVSETLALSELFGHEKGAFTGANRRRDGAFRGADGGTLFLDEVSRALPAIQGMILTAIDEGIIHPLGSDKPIRVRVRLIAATNQDLWLLAKQDKFAHDLLQRLAILPLKIPPLRERPEDLLPLAERYLASRGTASGAWRLAGEAVALLQDYPFPGNVRELGAVLERCQLHAQAEDDPHRDSGTRIIHESVVRDVLADWPHTVADDATPNPSIADQEAKLRRDRLANSLRRHGGKIGLVAEELGATRQTISKWIDRYGLQHLRSQVK